MVEVGQIRANETGTERVAIVSKREATGHFMLSDTPGGMTGPWLAGTIEAAWPRVVGITTDPGHYKLLSALEAFFARMGIPPQARDLPEVRRRVAGLFGLILPGDTEPEAHVFPTDTEVEREAMGDFWRLLGAEPSIDDGLSASTRAGLSEVFGFVEPPPPPWAQPGSYVFDYALGAHGVHIKVLKVEDGVATLEGFPAIDQIRTLGAGLLYLLHPRSELVLAGLLCEVCGRRQHHDGCGWAPCARCTPRLYGLVIDKGLMSTHLWWCRLTFDQKGCTCPEHEAKVPFWNATREGCDLEVAAGKPVR